VALGERRNRREVDLERVPNRHILHRRVVAGLEQRRELTEVTREAAGRDDLEKVQRFVARVPERVVLPTRLPHELARTGVDDVVSELRPEQAANSELSSGKWVVDRSALDTGAARPTGAPGTRHPAPGTRSCGMDDLRNGLRELYDWYRETEPMTGNVLRDAEVLPSLRRVTEPGLGAYTERAREALARPYGRDRRVNAAVRAVTDFHVWRALSDLVDEEAVELAAGLVELAAARRARPRRRAPQARS
jgi:hypothetical protein